MRLSKIAGTNTSHSWPLETLNNIPRDRLRFFLGKDTLSWPIQFFTQAGYCADAMFKAKVVRILCVVCPCLFALLLNCSALNSGKEQKRQIRRRCMVNCFHSGVETFRRTLADKVKNNGAVHDGCSLAITKVNASKYNGIHNQMQTLYYSNEFQVLEHPLHYHHEKNTPIVLTRTKPNTIFNIFLIYF